MNADQFEKRLLEIPAYVEADQEYKRCVGLLNERGAADKEDFWHLRGKKLAAFQLREKIREDFKLQLEAVVKAEWNLGEAAAELGNALAKGSLSPRTAAAVEIQTRKRDRLADAAKALRDQFTAAFGPLPQRPAYNPQGPNRDLAGNGGNVHVGGPVYKAQAPGVNVGGPR